MLSWAIEEGSQMQREEGETEEALPSSSLYYPSCSSCGPFLHTSNFIYLQKELGVDLCFTKDP